MEKKVLVSGIQPSGNVTLGNYLGAIKNFVALQKKYSDYELFIFIADMHSITVPQDRLALRKNIKTLAALYLACGLKEKNLNLFIQSEVMAHAQMSHIMQTKGYMGELERMTQYKDKKQKQEKATSVALFSYPLLMAGDILLYDADIVPTGEDQKQHLELTRTIAERFNHQHGDTFKIPEPFIAESGARIMSLNNPLKKMSKSDENQKSFISLLDDISVIKNKIKSAVTDSDISVHYDKENKPGISNLLTIYSLIDNKDIKNIEELYKDKTYKDFKFDLADIVADHILNIQNKYNDIINSNKIDDILDKGQERASLIANRKIKKVYHKVGLGRKR